MSITVADNFQYKGGKPLDARMKFSSVANMVATPAADLYDGCFAYVTATKKYYSYDSSNTSDPTLGKWTEYSSGGGGETYSDFTGATSQSAGVHGLVPAPQIADKDKFLKGDGTWAEVALPNVDYSNMIGNDGLFSTDEKLIGQWIDGKPLYQKTVNFGTLPNNDEKSVLHNISGIDNIVDVFGIGKSSSDWMPIIYPGVSTVSFGISMYVDNTKIYITTGANRSGYGAYVTIRYTKTTDSAMAIGASNEYSTTEKIVGNWIDLKPIYQKIVTHGGRIPLLSTLIKRDVLDNGYDILRYTKNVDPKLPSGYTEVEYIENPQSEYLDTGYIPDINGFRVVGDLTFTGFSASWDDILGIYNGGTSAAASFGRYNTTQQFRMTGMGGEGTSGNAFVVNTKYDFDVSFVNGSKYLKIDGATVIQPSGTANCPAYSIYFFAANKQNAPIANEYFVGRLGRTVIFNSSDSLVKYYIPCTRDSDDAVGMYETVGGQFFTSSGSGSFIAGDPVI